MCRVKNQLCVRMHQILEPEGTLGPASVLRRQVPGLIHETCQAQSLCHARKLVWLLFLFLVKSRRWEGRAPRLKVTQACGKVTIPGDSPSPWPAPSFLPPLALLHCTHRPAHVHVRPGAPARGRSFRHGPTCIPAPPFTRRLAFSRVRVRLIVHLAASRSARARPTAVRRLNGPGAPSQHPAFLLPSAAMGEKRPHLNPRGGARRGCPPFPRGLSSPPGALFPCAFCVSATRAYHSASTNAMRVFPDPSTKVTNPF